MPVLVADRMRYDDLKYRNFIALLDGVAATSSVPETIRRPRMSKIAKAQMITAMLTVGLLGGTCSLDAAAIRIEGQVQAGGGPVANSTVTLWIASADSPRQLAQTRTSADGRFDIRSQETPGRDVILYLVAKGGKAAVNKSASDN